MNTVSFSTSQYSSSLTSTVHQTLDRARRSIPVRRDEHSQTCIHILWQQASVINETRNCYYRSSIQLITITKGELKHVISAISTERSRHINLCPKSLGDLLWLDLEAFRETFDEVVGLRLILLQFSICSGTRTKLVKHNDIVIFATIYQYMKLIYVDYVSPILNPEASHRSNLEDCT